jgi:hypothetical protein
MDEISNLTVCTFDHGNNVELALRLSREFGRSLYFKPWKRGSPITNEKIIGDGFLEIERVRDFFDVIHEVDLFVFPEIHDGDLQRDLVNRGKRVWGSRKADEYEYNRLLFAKTLKEVGLPSCPYHRCEGMTALRDYLKKTEDVWIKTDMRGDGETWHHLSYNLSRAKLDAMDYYYGPYKEYVRFMCFESIDSIVEVAYDGFMVTSPVGKVQFPEQAFLGYEDKNKSHILAACPYDSLDDCVKEVNDKFAPKLAERYYRSAWGTEIKKTDDSFFFLDATCRQPSPPGFIILEMVSNLGEFMYHGAEGDMIDLELEEQVGLQVNIYSDWAGANHLPVEIPEEIRRWVKLEECYQDEDGLDWVIPPAVEDPVQGFHKNIGAVVATSDTIESAIELVKERCEMVKGFDTDTQIESLMETLRRIKQGEKEGVEFPVDSPQPVSVLED